MKSNAEKSLLNIENVLICIKTMYKDVKFEKKSLKIIQK